MSHFVAGNLPSTFGVAAQLDTLAKSFGTHASSTVNTSTEGTDQLTFAVPVSGWYNVKANLRVTTANNGGTSATIQPLIAFTNGVAGGAPAIIAATAMKDIGSNATAVSTLNAQGTAYSTHGYWTTNIYAAAGTNIVLNVAEVAGGTANSAGKYDIHFVISGVTQG